MRVNGINNRIEVGDKIELRYVKQVNAYKETKLIHSETVQAACDSSSSENRVVEKKGTGADLRNRRFSAVGMGRGRLTMRPVSHFSFVRCLIDLK